MTNVLEPWVLLVLATQALAFAVALRAVLPAYKVLRYFDVSRATEGQLSLERQVQLSATFGRVAFALQTFALLFFMLATDKLRYGIRGAMCSYGVLAAHDLGFPALYACAAATLCAGIGAEVCAFDDHVRTTALARPVAIIGVALAAIIGVALFVQSRFLLGLDLTVVSSCCSVQLDADTVSANAASVGPRIPVSVAAVVLSVIAIGLAAFCRARPRRSIALASGISSLATVPFAIGAAVLEIAPYAFETPNHLCPFCLFRTDEGGLGYLFFGAVLLAGVRGGGLFAASLLARTPALETAIAAFARKRAAVSATAWVVALASGMYPVLRFTLTSGGASLFR